MHELDDLLVRDRLRRFGGQLEGELAEQRVVRRVHADLTHERTQVVDAMAGAHGRQGCRPWLGAHEPSGQSCKQWLALVEAQLFEQAAEYGCIGRHLANRVAQCA